MEDDMKRLFSILLAAACLFAFFAGCGEKSESAESPAAETTEGTENAVSTQTPSAETEEPSPYNYAIGKVPLDEKGFPTEKYEYPLPLTTSDEVLTYWYTNYVPQSIPGGDYPTSPFPVEVENQTGVNIEYVMISPGSLIDNFAVLLASDDLCDITHGAEYFYSGDFRKAVVDDQYFINICDYKDYCPNYIYEARRDLSDTKTLETVFVESDLILSFYIMMTLGDGSGGMNYFARGDRLEKLGLSNEDIKTFDDWHDMLLRAKTEIPECIYPTYIFRTIELTHCWGPGYDTLAIIGQLGDNKFVIDGQPKFANTTEGDKALMTMISQWYSEGLIDPNWASYGNNEDMPATNIDGTCILAQMTDNGTAEHQAIIDEQSPDSDRGWEPLVRPVQYEGQVLHLGGEKTRTGFGSAAVASKSSNIELAVTWLDWRYSDTGSFLMSYGVEGVSWEYNEEGKPQLTELMYNNPEQNLTMLSTVYTASPISDPALLDSYALYQFPNNNRQYVKEYWQSYEYDNAYSWPTGAKPTAEQRAVLANYTADLSTYIQENFSAFIDGSKPMSDWDSYIAGLYEIGMQEVIDIYQQVYNDYLERKAAEA
jgi:putative aldouronate transport system substrate-binding protein